MQYNPVFAPRGNKLSCANWQIEAPFRMIQNNLDPEVAEKPQDLVVYGGSGKAARNWESFHKIVATLRSLKPDETLLVQSGKPVAVFRTHAWSPRVLIANSLLVPAWANWDYFRKLEAMGLIMYGQMTAGSWIYIGTQGILQGTYETFGEAARTHYQSTLKGKFVLSAGLGGMGGAQPLAVTLNGGVFLGVDVDPAHIQKRLDTRYLDTMTDKLDQALEWVSAAVQQGEAKSIGLVGNASEVYPELVRRSIIPDMVTDQTSAHDLLNGYVPGGMTLAAAVELRQKNPQEYLQKSQASVVAHVEAMLAMQQQGAVAFDYGNNIRAQAQQGGVKNAFDIPGFVPKYIRPLFCEGKGPFRWVALSGDPRDIYYIDEVLLREFADNEPLCRWIRYAKERVKFQGLPARICWLGYGDRARFGHIINQLVAAKKISAPVVIGRDHLDCGSVASPNRETEAMQDGSDAIADWPILNALLNTSSGATWVSVHHGGGVGIGYSIHAGMVICADGTQEMEVRLDRVLTGDPGIGVARHADAGYESAIAVANTQGINIPMLAQKA